MFGVKHRIAGAKKGAAPLFGACGQVSFIINFHSVFRIKNGSSIIIDDDEERYGIQTICYDLK